MFSHWSSVSSCWVVHLSRSTDSAVLEVFYHQRQRQEQDCSMTFFNRISLMSLLSLMVITAKWQNLQLPTLDYKLIRSPGWVRTIGRKLIWEKKEDRTWLFSSQLNSRVDRRGVHTSSHFFFSSGPLHFLNTKTKEVLVCYLVLGRYIKYLSCFVKKNWNSVWSHDTMFQQRVVWVQFYLNHSLSAYAKKSGTSFFVF